MHEHEAKRFIGRWEHELRAKLNSGSSRHEAVDALLQEQPELVRDFLAASLDLIDPDQRKRCARKGQTPL